MIAVGTRVKSIFLEAVENWTPDEWAVYLDRACDGDAQLRGRIEVLLQAHQHKDELLDAPELKAGEIDQGLVTEGP